jgi:UDP-glucose 4-epimerase
MKGKQIIVTGGAGFIGSNLVRALVKNNEVVVIDDLSTGDLKNIIELIHTQEIKFVEGSITDLALLKKNFKDIDYVFHEAAIPSVPRSVKDPIKSHLVNANGTLNVLLAARDNEVEKVVYASSSSAYGETPVLPKREDMAPSPLSPYAVSKLMGEYYCKVFAEVYDLSTVSLRYFNVYGPRQDPLSEYAAVVPRFITRIIKGESPIIYGDGSQTRDFTYVNDVVHANIKAAESKAQDVFNISFGKKISINELARLLMEIMEKNVEIIHDNPRPGDIKDSCADISRAKKYFNYNPTFNLEKGLRETIAWFQNKN